MKELDNLLKGSKKEAPIVPLQFSKQIMQEIKTQQLSVKPAPVKNNVSLICLVTGLASLFIGFILFNHSSYEIKMNGSVEILYMGTRFLSEFGSYLPIDLIIFATTFTLFSIWLLKQSHYFKKGLVWLTLGSFTFTTIGGTAMAQVGFNDAVKQAYQLEEKQVPIVSSFYKNRAHFSINRQKFQIGQVVARDDKSLTILNPYGEKVVVKVDTGDQHQIGDFFRIAGKFEGDVFHVQAMDHCAGSRVSRYFSGNHADMMQDMMKNGGMMKGHQMMHQGGMKGMMKNMESPTDS